MPRRKPFSSKQKKKQLQERRLRKQGQPGANSDSDSDFEENEGGTEAMATKPEPSTSRPGVVSVTKINQQPAGLPDRRLDPNRFRLHFFKESDEELHKRKAACKRVITLLQERDLETDIDSVYKPGTVLDMPKRPEWDTTMSKEMLGQREDGYFQNYLDNIFSVYGPQDLSFFDMNLETWRQLWRVTEMADILLLITDIRHPALHFSPALYDHVTRYLDKPMVLVLNKVDLAPLGLVAAWRDYFQKCFPKLQIVYFTSHAEATKKPTTQGLRKGYQKGRQIKSVGSKELLEVCENIAGGKVDLSSWRSRVESQDLDKDNNTVEDASDDASAAVSTRETTADSYQRHVRYRDGVLTIGCVGYPNVGKSSLINGLVGKKVVSVSKSPGHTKHFQTIFLTPTVKLCDCPGLVFPSLIPKPLQIIAGIYPIAQVREPYSAIAYLATRVNIPSILKLKHQDVGKQEEEKWSTFDICTAWAIKCGYNTARGARPDIYRAANHIMRLTVEGRIRLNFTPPGYTDSKETWREHPDVMKLLKQGQAVIRGYHKDIGVSSSSDSEAEEVTSSETANQRSEEDGGSLDVSNPFDLLSDE